MKEFIGILSGILVALTIIPYSIRTYQGKIQPNLISWSIWTVLGLAILLTYKGSGAKDNVWPAIFGFANPLIITLLCLWKGEKKKPDLLEISCLIAGIISITMWWFMRENKHLVQYALYIALIADVFAGIPTTIFVWKNPFGDRPFAWTTFALAYGLSMFAISEHTFANYVLPVYMLIFANIIALPLIYHRVKNKTPLREWV